MGAGSFLILYSSIEWPDFNTASSIQGRATVRQRGGILQVIGLNDDKTAQHLPDFHEGSIGDHPSGPEHFTFRCEADSMFFKSSLGRNASYPVFPFLLKALQFTGRNFAVLQIRLPE